MKSAGRTFRQFLPDFFTNLPLRFLLYLAAEYESLVAKTGENIYGQTLVPLPTPQCIVFYNGDDETEEEQHLRLTDAFRDELGVKTASCLELEVRVLNINYGHNRQLMSDCRRLEEYSRFVDRIKKYCRDGFSTDQAVENAVVYCIEHGILEDILLPFRAEVKKMLLTEYNEKKYMKMFRKEAREEGLKEGRQEERKRLLNNMFQNGATAEEISKLTGLSLAEIENIRQNNKQL